MKKKNETKHQIKTSKIEFSWNSENCAAHIKTYSLIVNDFLHNLLFSALRLAVNLLVSCLSTAPLYIRSIVLLFAKFIILVVANKQALCFDLARILRCGFSITHILNSFSLCHFSSLFPMRPQSYAVCVLLCVPACV